MKYLGQYMLYVLSGTIFLVMASAYALEGQKGGRVTFSFSGRLVAASPCKVNNDNTIEVDFENVAANNEKIDSGMYIRDFKYELECQGATPSSTVKLILWAEAAQFNTTTTIRTSLPVLGVQILDEGKAISLNTVMKINEPFNAHKLQARLVRDPDIDVRGVPTQEFSAAGTLMAEYI